MWVLFAFGSAFCSGLTSIFAKFGVKNTDSNIATALRTIIILGFSWIMVILNGSYTTLNTVSNKTFLFLILSGIATGASWLCYFRALQLGDVNKVIPIDKSSTLITMLLAFIIFRENFTMIKLAAMILIAVGTYMMIQKKKDINPERKGIAWLFYASASAIFASMTSILGKIGISGIDSTLGTAIRTIVVLIMAWLIVFITKKYKNIKVIDKKSGVFLCLSGLATGGAWLCYYRALQIGPASCVVPIDKLSIIVTMLFSYFALKEKFVKKTILGLISIITGTLLLLV